MFRVLTSRQLLGPKFGVSFSRPVIVVNVDKIVRSFYVLTNDLLWEHMISIKSGNGKKWSSD